MKENREAMRAAYERIKAVRPDWPMTFDEAMQDLLLRAVLRTFVQHPAALDAVIERTRRFTLDARNLADTANTQPAELDAARDPKPAPRFLDFKSRAAGEREDD